MNLFLSKLVDYLAGKLLDWITEKALKDNKFSGISKSINNEELKELIKNSLEISMNNEKIKQLDEKDIEESLKENMSLIFEWILLSDEDDISFPVFSDKIKYTVNEDIFRMLYKSLFYQIQAYKHNYPTLQNLMILDRQDTHDNKMTNYNVEIHKKLDLIIEQTSGKNIVYTGELKEIEEKIHLRQFKKAQVILNSLEHKILEKDDPDEKEKFYQLLTDSYFLDTEKQHEAIEPLKKLILFTIDDKKKRKRELFKDLLEKSINLVQEKLNVIFSDTLIDEIDQSYIDIQINVFINRKEFDFAIDFIQKYKDRVDRFPLWACRLYYYQSNIKKAKQIINENEDFFNKSDFDIQVIKIYVLASFHLEKAMHGNTFQNNEDLKMIIPKVLEVINICEDDLGEKSQMHSILGIIYTVLNDKNNAKKEYEKSLEFNHKNMNTIKNYPFILLDSRNKEDKEKALEYIKQYLTEYPEDTLIESLYYNALVIISPQRAIIELENYNGENEYIKPSLIFAYDKNYEFTKAEELITDFLNKDDISSSTYFFIGLHNETIRKYEIAIEYYFKAIEKCETNNESDRIVDKILQVTVLSKNNKLMKKGIDIIECYVSFDEIILMFIEKFSHVLILLHDYEKCFYYCDTALKQGIKTKSIYESLFCCYYNTRNFHLAIEIVEEYIKEFGHSLPPNFLEAIAICYIEIKKMDKARDIIKYLPYPESVNDFMCQIHYLTKIEKNIEAINMAHKAYLTFPRNQYVMEQFIQLGMLNKGNNILSEDIAINLRQCFNDYISSDFPNKVIKEFKIDTKAAPEEILKQISAILPDNSEEIYKLEIINENKLPVSFYKNVINKNILVFYYYLFNQNKYRIWCHNNLLKLNFRNVLNSKSIYIDIGSLLLLNNLNLLETLPEVFSEIFVLQSTFNELYNFEAEILYSKERILLNKDDKGNISIYQENLPYDEILENSKRIIAYIKNNKTFKVVGKPLKKVNNLHQELLKLIKSTKDNDDFAILEYGFMSNTPIMLENYLLRELFNSIKDGPKAAGVIDYLQFLISINKITFGQYCNILYKMSKQNYVSLPFSYKVLFYIIKNNGYVINNPITYIFDILFSDDYSKEYSCVNITAVLYMIWGEMIPVEIKYRWTDYIMDKIISYFKPVKNYLSTISDNITKYVYNMKSQKELRNYIKKYIDNYNPEKDESNEVNNINNAQEDKND